MKYCVEKPEATEEGLRQAVIEWEKAAEAVREGERLRHIHETTIDDLMNRMGTTEIEISVTKLVRKERVHYEQGLLDPLREHLSPEEIEQFLTAPRPAPPRKWNLTKVKKLAKRGGAYRATLEAATYTEPARVRLQHIELRSSFKEE